MNEWLPIYAGLARRWRRTCGSRSRRSSPTGAMPSLAVMLLVALLSASCAGGNDNDPYSLAAAGLCEATMKAEVGEGEEARRVFYDIVHQPLHDLAAETSQVDRAVAAVLLEAKESVESALDQDRADLAASLQSLVGAADAALSATGHSSIPCPTGGVS